AGIATVNALVGGSAFAVAPATVTLTESPKPSISDLKISFDKIKVGEKLKATYAFHDNGGNSEDKSVYVWGHQGETAGRVGISTETISESGQVPVHEITNDDIAKVVEIAVLPKNGIGLTGDIVKDELRIWSLGIKKVRTIEKHSYDYPPTIYYPHVGFTGAKFALLTENDDPSLYHWSSDAGPAVSIEVQDKSVQVSMTGKPTQREVTITGQSKDGKDKVVYKYQIARWYYKAGHGDIYGARSACKGGSRLPNLVDIFGTKNLKFISDGTAGHREYGLSDSFTRGVGTLFSEFDSKTIMVLTSNWHSFVDANGMTSDGAPLDVAAYDGVTSLYFYGSGLVLALKDEGGSYYAQLCVVDLY
ncbi:hypothetical protein PTR22_25360, partial [Serratia ureilytica]